MASAFVSLPRQILLLFALYLTALSAHAGWNLPSSPQEGASCTLAWSGPSAGYVAGLCVQAPGSSTWTFLAAGGGNPGATKLISTSYTFTPAGSWALKIVNGSSSSSPTIDSATLSVAGATTSTSFSFSNLTFTYDGSTKTASVTPNPGNATYTADLTKGPGVGSYTVSATATGSFTGSGSATLIINAAPDTSAPSTPGNVRVTAFDQSSVTFAWDASSDNVGVTGYQVRLNQGSPVTASGLSHTFYGLTNNTNYLLEVRAGDAAGNWSGWGGASASTGGSGGGGSGSGTSMWLDVDGDGIRDEVVKSGTADFSHAIDWWYTQDSSVWNVQVNTYWMGWDVFNPENGAWLGQFAYIWRGETYFNPSYQITFGVTFTIAPRSGRQIRIMMDPNGSSTASPASWAVIQPHMGPIGQPSFTYSQPFSSASSLDGTAFYVAHLGTPVTSLQFNDSLGNILVNSAAVNGSANLILPYNNQITLGVRDTVGFINAAAHSVVWKILDAVGNVLRQGSGLNVNFDNLNFLPIAQLVIVLDSAPPKAVNVTVGKPVFITPAGNPETAPVDAGTNAASIPDGANEFTFSTLNTGVLTLKLKATIAGLSGAPQADKDKLTFAVTSVGGSTKAWAAANPDGKPTITGDILEASVTFTGLPANNADFGAKTAAVLFDGQILVTQTYEVFFSRDATNHPGGETGSPNWYYYWSQLISGVNLHYGGSGAGSTAAEVLAMSAWSYTTAQNKTQITVYNTIKQRGSAYGVGEEFSGIDQFMAQITHEQKHVTQVAAADALLSSTGSDSFRYGWSWNKLSHNHWKKGPDAQWGVAGTDDDGNTVVDDAAVSPPFEPGHGDDEDLCYSATYRDWPKAWALPNPNNVGTPSESEAVNASDSAHNENDHAGSDWGNPGKKHATVNVWDD